LNELSNPLQIRYRDGGRTPPAHAARSICVSERFFILNGSVGGACNIFRDNCCGQLWVLKKFFGVIQGHRKWHGSIQNIQLPINVA